MQKAEMRHVVITGGGSGIGLATAQQLRKDGSKVTILDLAGPAEDAARKIEADFLAVDVTDEDAVNATAEQLEKDVAPDGLVTCAGLLQRTLPPDALSWAEWDRVIAVHLRGTYACCRSFGSLMAARRDGAIVTVSSVAGITSSPLHGYGPAKAAIAHLSQTLAAEWGPAQVRVNSVAPGFTTTPALERGLTAGALEADRLAKSAALQRLVIPQEIAEAIVFLLSPRSSAVTGVVMPVDAGYLVAGGWAAYGGLRDGRPALGDGAKTTR